MSDYRYGDVMSMQEAAIRRVNEMQRRAREAARLANEELSVGVRHDMRTNETKAPSDMGGSRQAGHTNLPVDYLHGGMHPSGRASGYMENVGNNSSHKENLNEKESANRRQSSSAQGDNAESPRLPKSSDGIACAPKDEEKGKNGKSPSASGGKKSVGNAWAQTAVNRQQKQILQSRPQTESNMSRHQSESRGKQKVRGEFSPGDNGIFSALGTVMGAMDNDTILLLGLLYILWRDGADYGLLLALFYILM